MFYLTGRVVETQIKTQSIQPLYPDFAEYFFSVFAKEYFTFSHLYFKLKKKQEQDYCGFTLTTLFIENYFDKYKEKVHRKLY